MPEERTKLDLDNFYLQLPGGSHGEGGPSFLAAESSAIALVTEAEGSLFAALDPSGAEISTPNPKDTMGRPSLQEICGWKEVKKREREEQLALLFWRNRAAGFKQCITKNNTANIVMFLYGTVVQTHLQYSVQFFSPYLRKGHYRAGKSAEEGNQGDQGARAFFPW